MVLKMKLRGVAGLSCSGSDKLFRVGIQSEIMGDESAFVSRLGCLR